MHIYVYIYSSFAGQRFLNFELQNINLLHWFLKHCFGTVKGLNMDIKDFKDQLIFSIVLKRERNPGHTQAHTSFATELKSILSVNFSW